jgi:putative membrane protein
MPQLIVFAAVTAWSTAAVAHQEGAASDPVAMMFDVLLAILLIASSLLYAVGVAALWRKAGAGRGIRRVETARFALGWSLLVVALYSPLDELAEHSFGLHMIQHELLMVMAAPLLVLARPLEAFAWALPPGVLGFFIAIARARILRKGWRVLVAPAGAWCVHALALWFWHVPAFFVAALASPSLHVLQHTCFFLSALAFWWAVFGAGIHAPDGRSLACLFTMMLYTSALGALLTVAPVPLYMTAGSPIPFGLSALEDQQLGGLVMWAPGGLAYLVAALAIVGTWLSSARTSGNWR